MKTQHHPHAHQAPQGEPAVPARPQQGPQHGAQHDPRQPVVHGRYTYQHARSGNPQQRPSPPPNNPLRRPPRGPAANAARQQETTAPRDERQLDNDKDDGDMDGQGRRQQDFGSDLGSDTQQSFAERDDADDEARRRALQNVRVPPRRKPAPATHVLARSGLPGVATLVVPPASGTRCATEQLQALATVLLASARQGGRRDASTPPPGATVLAAVQQHLVGQAGAPPAPMTLDDVKGLLMSLPQSPPPPPPSDADRQRVENSLLLLPLVILNATRPRTRAQRRQAVDRLQLLRSSPGLG